MSASDMRPVGLLGSGGHAKVILGLLRALGRDAQAVFDDDPGRWGRQLCGVPIVGAIAEAPEGLPLVGAIGNNRVRQKLAEEFADHEFVTLVHPHAWVDPTARVGTGSVVFAGCVIQADAVLGAQVIVNTGASVDHDAVVGAYCHLAPGVRLAGGVKVGTGSFLGTGAVAIPYVEIGEWTTVGAGAAVVTNLPSGITAVGVPAKAIERGKS